MNQTNLKEYVERLRKLEVDAFNNDMPTTGTRLAQKRIEIESKLLLKEIKETE